jgi:hypothetical protein
MKNPSIRIRRNMTGIILVIAAAILLVTGLVAQAQGIESRGRGDQTLVDDEFLGGLWAAHDGPDSRHRNFFPFYYEVGEGANSTWSSPLLFSGGRIKSDGSEEVRLFGGLIRHSVDRSGQ